MPSLHSALLWLSEGPPSHRLAPCPDSGLPLPPTHPWTLGPDSGLPLPPTHPRTQGPDSGLLLENSGINSQVREGGREEGRSLGPGMSRASGRLEAHTLQSRETPESNQGRGRVQVGPDYGVGCGSGLWEGRATLGR